MALEDPSSSAPRPQGVGAILANRAFVPVFQPIVDIATGMVVGYEALSRFDDDRPAADVFAEARAVGLDLDLELATLRAALVAARRLPGGRWLDVNISREALEDPRLRSAVAIADRRIVLELRADDACCDDAVGRAVRALEPHASLALVAGDPSDSVSPGIAPHLIKLSRALTVRATTEPDPDWLAALAGRTASTTLVAEGVETPDEAKRLLALGVELGQGHHFGRPALATVRPSAVN